MTSPCGTLVRKGKVVLAFSLCGIYQLNNYSYVQNQGDEFNTYPSLLQHPAKEVAKKGEASEYFFQFLTFLPFFVALATESW